MKRLWIILLVVAIFGGAGGAIYYYAQPRTAEELLERAAKLEIRMDEAIRTENALGSTDADRLAGFESKIRDAWLSVIERWPGIGPLTSSVSSGPRTRLPCTRNVVFGFASQDDPFRAPDQAPRPR